MRVDGPSAWTAADLSVHSADLLIARLSKNPAALEEVLDGGVEALRRVAQAVMPGAGMLRIDLERIYATLQRRARITLQS